MSRIWDENLRVLIVEDDYLTARLFQTRLELEGIQTSIAFNGLEALQIIGDIQIHAIVTDLMMPAMSGFQLIQEIRSLPAPMGRIPIMVISSNQNEQDMVSCFAAGADDFMTKPISTPLFIERLWRLLHRRS